LTLGGPCAPSRSAERERRADVFAAEVLVPLEELHDMMPRHLRPRTAANKRALADIVDRAASRFNVPRSFIRWRMKDLLHLRRSSFFLPL
jgi:Zn-dependent peptidase ImmA (M78 family)